MYVDVSTETVIDRPLHGSHPALHLRVTELDSSHLVMRTAEGPFPMETTYTWDALGSDRTTMGLRNRGRPSGFATVTAPVMAAAMRRANTKDLAR